MIIDTRQLLAFFDERADVGHHASAIKAVAGEELGFGLLVEFLRRQDEAAEVLARGCTTGHAKGARLDGWVKVESGAGQFLYQVEVKSWSAHSLHGRPLRVSSTTEELIAFKRERWNRYWCGNRFRDKELEKVLTPMKPPVAGLEVRPLACLWDAVHPTGKADPFFVVPLQGRDFPQVAVFSMSGFLRGLDAPTVAVDMPFAAERLDWLKKIFVEVTEG
jgi:hypothetical protein